MSGHLSLGDPQAVDTLTDDRHGLVELLLGDGRALRVGRAAGATVNDVLLATCAQAFRDLRAAFEARTGKPAPRVKGRVRAMQGTFSGGTAASLGATMKAAAKVMTYAYVNPVIAVLLGCLLRHEPFMAARRQKLDWW